MKFIAIVIAALASVTAAAPLADECSPGAYRYEADGRAYSKCNSARNWVMRTIQLAI